MLLTPHILHPKNFKKITKTYINQLRVPDDSLSAAIRIVCSEEMVRNVMTEAFNIDNDKKGLKTASQQIAARQHALEEIDRATFGWYHIRYAFLSHFLI